MHDLRRTLPRYHWRPLAGIRVGGGLADLQRLCLQHGIALPTSFALVGKTLSQAEAIAPTELDAGGVYMMWRILRTPGGLYRRRRDVSLRSGGMEMSG